MDPALFLADLEHKPTTLRAAAAVLETNEWRWPIADPRRVVLIGMGSSLYAAQVAALRMRRAGIVAIAESGSAERTLPVGRDDLVIGISAGGSSIETNTLFATCAAATTVALTNTLGSAITDAAAHSVPLHAETERGGVACRSYTHTLIALLQLEQQLTGVDLALAETVDRAADATQHLLEMRGEWLEAAVDVVDGPTGSWMIAPLERLASAMQSALMMRECPRRAAVGCETGDWSHVDVYLTRTLDYRAVVFPGSRWDESAAQWLIDRAATVLSVGGEFRGAGSTVRYPGDDHPLVRLLVETTVVELIAARMWATPRPIQEQR